nr:hypothetical protein Iba_chr01cCG7800 [Ipomoea batatas]GMC53599.1 hypothetical protein Iba_chr01dCG8150 [Ipomoea batatas]
MQRPRIVAPRQVAAPEEAAVGSGILVIKREVEGSFVPLAHLRLALDLPIARELRRQHVLRAARLRVQLRDRVRRLQVISHLSRQKVGVFTHPEAVALLTSGPVNVGEPVLMHDPIRLLSFRRLAGVKHQRLLDPHWFRLSDRLIGSGCLPVTSPRRPVRPRTVRILPVSRREEVPLFFAVQRHICNAKIQSHHFQSLLENRQNKSEREIQSIVFNLCSKTDNKSEREIQSHRIQSLLENRKNKSGREITGEIPGVELVEINLGDNRDGNRQRRTLAAQIVHH